MTVTIKKPGIALAALLLTAAAGCGSAVPTPTIDSQSVSTGIPSVVAAIPALGDAVAPVLTVTGIVDGDTVDLSDGTRVRVLGLDTPERGDCGFVEASQFATDSLLHKQVVATPDPTQDKVDRYDRSLLYLDVAGADYSAAAIATGWAKHYVFNNKPVQRAPNLAAAETLAKAQKLGIWGPLCAAPAPPPVQAPPTQVRVEKPVAEPKPEMSFFKNCDAARAAGAAPLHRGDAGYRSGLDRDDDGVACE